jgi:hypothetical protein
MAHAHSASMLSPTPISPPFASGMQSVGSFQHLLAMMSARNGHALGVEANAHRDDLDNKSDPDMSPTRMEGRIPSPTRSVSPGSRSASADVANPVTSSPPSGQVETERRSSSIAALRLRAREYEMKIQLGQQYNKGMVY